MTRRESIEHPGYSLAGWAGVGLLCANALPPYGPVLKEMGLLWLVAGALHYALVPSRLRVGSGWPALAWSTGWASSGAAWLLSLHLGVRLAYEAVGKRRAPRQLVTEMGHALPVLAAIAMSRLLPLPKATMLAPLAFLGLTLLSESGPRSVTLRRSAEELLWSALLVIAAGHGLWPLLAAQVALLLVFSRVDGASEEELRRGFARQLTTTESTLRASQQRFEQDKSYFRNLLALQQTLDAFQGKALQASGPAGVATALIDAVLEMDEGCQAAVCAARGDNDLSIARSSPRFSLADFQPLPKGWRSGEMLRSSDGKRAFYALGGDLFFLIGWGGGEREEQAFVQGLLARARLLLQILEQKRELAGLLHEKTEALEQLADSQAQLLQSEKLAAIGQLAAGVAHEINSPLAAIHLQAQMARRRLGKDDRQGVLRSLETCEQASLRAKSIIESLLAFSQFSDGARAPATLAQLALNTLRLLEGHLEEAAIAHKCVFPELPPLLVNAQEIEQILTNIILNAVEALKERDSDRRLMLSSTAGQSEQRLTIANNGPPLSEEVQERLFDPFFTTKEIGQGTGLGLSIAYQLARGQGGTIVATNQQGWVHFTLTLPV